MTWTLEQKLTYLLKLPWTIVPDATPEGDLLVRVRELPAVVGCGTTPKALEADFWDAMETALRSYLHFGDRLPLPPKQVLPWEQPAPPVIPPARLRVRIVRGKASSVRDADTQSDGVWETLNQPEGKELVEA